LRTASDADDDDGGDDAVVPVVVMVVVVDGGMIPSNVHHNVEFAFPKKKKNRFFGNCGTLGGMETVIINLAFKQALAQVTGFPKCSLLIVHEGLSSFDRERMSNLQPIMDMFRTHYSSTLLITHSDGANDSADTQCEIKMLNDGSRCITIEG